MKIKPVLWDQRPLKDKTFPIKIRVTVGAKVKYFPVQASVKKNQWDAKSGRVRTDTSDLAPFINDKIRQMVFDLEVNYLKGNTITTNTISDDFYKHWEDRIQYTLSKHSTGHYKRLKTVLAKLKEFRPEVKIKEINHDFLKGFEMHLIKKGNGKNTIHENFVRVKTVVKDLVSQGLLEYHKNPFLNFKAEQQKVERIRLDKEQINKLETAELTGNNKKARDMYVFSFYCAGIRFGDMCRIREHNFNNGRLIYTAHKTNRQRRIKMMPQAINIIKEYNYSFGIDITFKAISSANAKLNMSLKRVAKKLELPPITFHTSRHSFVDFAIKNKFDAHLIKDLIGHDRIATTEIYLKSFYEEETDNAMDELFGDK
jgi:site-specific recombinase XerD